MAFDAHSNFGYSTVAVAPAPPNAGLSLTVAAGQGALFPAAPFNCTVWPSGVQPLASNAEIVRVTNIVGDTLTIVRAQEGTAAIAIAVGFQIGNTTSVKVFTDIEAAIPVQFVSNISAGAQSASGAVVFSNSNGVSFGMNAGTLTASVVPAGQSTQPVAASAGNGSFLFSTVSFSNANGISFSTSAGGAIVASHNALTSQSNQAFSASGGSSAFQTLNFANSNGLTFSNSNGSVIASYTVPTQSTQPVAASATNGSFTFATLGFSNANNVTFGTSAGGVITASVNTAAAGNSVNFSAGATSNNLASIVFSNANNISFGLTGSTITGSIIPGAGAALASFFQNEPAYSLKTNFVMDATFMRGCVFQLPYDISAGFIRIPVVNNQAFLVAQQLSTTANMSVQALTTYYAMIYTTGTGASSNSMMLLTSGSAGWTVLNSVSQGTLTNVHSYTQAITGAVLGASFTQSNTYTVSDPTNYQFGSDPFLTNFSSNRFIDINFATTLSGGAYAIMFGIITSSLTNATRLTGVTTVAPQYVSWYGNDNFADLRFTQMGLTSNSSLGINQNWGFQVSGTASSTYTALPISSFNPTASGRRPVFQIARSA